MQRGCCAKRLRVDFPRDSRPVYGRTARHAVETHTVFSIRSGFLKPHYGAVLGFFDCNESALASGSLKCLKFLHSSFSIGAFVLERWPQYHIYYYKYVIKPLAGLGYGG